MNRRQMTTLTLGAMLAPAAARAAQTASVEPLPLPQPGVAIKVAMLIDENVTPIDYIGPWEVFQDAGPDNYGFELYTVSPNGGIIATTGGGEVKARYSVADAPQPNVVVIPAQAGGRTDRPSNQAKIAWLRRIHPQTDVILSVCTGNFLMARTGLLDGRMATTHHGFYDEFEKTFPQVKLQRGRRFVDNGKFVSAGGLTSSIDGALHVVHRYFGEAEAARVAAWMEHDGDGWRTGAR